MGRSQKQSIAYQMPNIFRCPSTPDDTNDTSYVAVVGPETGWPAPQCSSQPTIVDGTSKTIAVVEIVHSGINWLEPRDLTFDEALRGVNPPGVTPAISSAHPGGANVIFFDAYLIFLKDASSIDVLKGWLTAAGREHVVDPRDR